ncbi:hypothetical protein [Burkholderia orbicola]|uniref:hypothetical protein n=1 Tax=Burkholderia orbicola TaxID=2978683 RepID=UPI002FDFC80E
MTTSKFRAKKAVRKPAAQKLREKRLQLAVKSRSTTRSEAVELLTGQRPAVAVQVVRVALKDAAVSRSELTSHWSELSDTQRTALTTARARAEARLRRPDMAPEAVRARERAGAEWEARHGVVTAFAGRRHAR